jgi:uncharacterized protein
MNWKFWEKTPQPMPAPPAKIDHTGLAIAVNRARADASMPHRFPIQPPVLMPGVVPAGEKPALAMDSELPGVADAWRYTLNNIGSLEGFPGYTYLSMLATRPEYRAFAETHSTELTREWITLNSSESSGDTTKKKVTELTQRLNDLNLRHVIQLASEHDSYFGRAQIFIDLKNHDTELPLILDSRTITKGSLVRIVNIEPTWTSPTQYDALHPQSPDFYNPSIWWMLGQKVHASRLLTIVTRPVPDLLKAAFNFSGMSMSQLAEPYVNNWLRTRQSVADLLNNFSITALKTSMDQVLSGGDDGSDLFKRAELFTLTRSNKGMMLLDKDREDLVQVNTPLGGLSELQAQAQEHMGTVSHEPMIILTGISPSGLNASSDGEIRAWENWIAATQESFYRKPIETILQVVQLDMYGEIDPDITFTFNSLHQLTDKEQSEMRVQQSVVGGNYIDRGVIDAQEERERLARDPESGYQGLDVSKVIETNVEEEKSPIVE